jgi:hypothetical protein
MTNSFTRPASIHQQMILGPNIVGLAHLYESARIHGIGRIVFASSNYAIGFNPRRSGGALARAGPGNARSTHARGRVRRDRPVPVMPARATRTRYRSVFRRDASNLQPDLKDAARCGQHLNSLFCQPKETNHEKT